MSAIIVFCHSVLVFHWNCHLENQNEMCSLINLLHILWVIICTQMQVFAVSSLLLSNTTLITKGPAGMNIFVCLHHYYY